MSLAIDIAQKEDTRYAEELSSWYRKSSEERGTGIAVRTAEYIIKKILSGHAIVAKESNDIIGFCYIESFDNKKYVSNSGLIVHSNYRNQGIARKIKELAFSHARYKYPEAKVFGITTSDTVMRINSELGYIPVPLHKLTSDDAFWKGCNSCKNYNILLSNDKRMCLCTGMLALSKIEQDLKEKQEKESQQNKENESGS